MKTRITDYILLTKPRIMILIILSGFTALVMEKSMLGSPWRILLALFALYLTGGAANALNNYFERDIDAKMTRTRDKRPLPQKRVSPQSALVFSITIGLAGVMILGLFYNWLSAGLSLATILFYSLFYTLVLKPGTSQNIVIGGAAGAMAPVGMWAAASGSLDITPWTLFLIIFFWSPPHFWALAINYKDDYKKAGYPMLPLVKGDNATLKQIFIFTIILFLTSLTPYLFKAGIIYLSLAIVLGSIFIYRSWVAWKNKQARAIWGVFGYSILYMFGILIAIIIDSIFPVAL